MESSANIQVKHGLFSSGTLKNMGTLPVVAILILMGLLSIQKSSAAFESPELLALLNTVFLCAIPIFVAYEAAKIHQTTRVDRKSVE